MLECPKHKLIPFVVSRCSVVCVCCQTFLDDRVCLQGKSVSGQFSGGICPHFPTAKDITRIFLYNFLLQLADNPRLRHYTDQRSSLSREISGDFPPFFSFAFLG
jgi:hypothetical protein